MKISNYIYTVLASLLLLTLSACRAEDDIPTINKEDCYQLQFGLSVLPPQTRALGLENGIDDPLNENKIATMDAFIYDDAGNQQGHYSTVKGDLVINAATNALAGTATIYVPKDNPLSTIYQGHNYNLYVLVNYHGTDNLDGKNLSDLKAIIMTSDNLVQSTVKPQDDFLMDGTTKTGIMSWATSNNYSVGQTVKLSRAAAKVRIRLDANIVIQDNKDIYDVVGEPTITFKSYTNQTSLFAGSPVPMPTYLSIDTEQPMVKTAHEGKQFWAREVPYYSYENDWSIDAKLRTYAVIKLRVMKHDDPGQKITDSYYSVPLNYLAVKDGMTQAEKDGLTKLQRNHLYDIECSIKQLGSAEPTKPVDMPYSYIAVEDWNTPDDIDAAITKAHYLVVKETHPEMLNVAERLVEYISDLPINVDKMNASIRHEYTQYNVDGSKQKITGGNVVRNSDNSYHSTIRVDTTSANGKKYLKITSLTPNNYVPRIIKFRVEQIQDPDDATATPLWKDVEVTQYPPIYVTAKESSGNPIYWYSAFTSYNGSGPGGTAGYQSNGTLFKITTLAPQDGQIVGDPTGGSERTGRDEESNKITSPQFIVASQWGMSTAVRQYNDNNKTPLGWYDGSDFNLENATNPSIEDKYAYANSNHGGTYSMRYRDYNSADSRAYNYWEDDYGISVRNKRIEGNENGPNWSTDWWGTITGVRSYNTKYWTHTFKYEDHWRIPTWAELALIVKIQKDPNSAVKSLLWGFQYWSAWTGHGYNFVTPGDYPSTGTMSIRPVFDTYDKNDSQDSNKW
uniref:DUF4906 domain-containing protein n=2 Tax=unclassified Prevotella TaxID=2638335 RepID=A0AB33JJY6_9BACT